MFLKSGLSALEKLPRYYPGRTTKVVSPNGKLVAFTKEFTTRQPDERGKLRAWGTHNDLYFSDTGGANLKPLFTGDYRDRNKTNNCGVRHFAWSSDSTFIVFDFIVEDIGGAYSNFDGRSLIGVVNTETGRGHFLIDSGCEPNFVGRSNHIIQFLSFEKDLLDSKIPGTPKFSSASGRTYYLHDNQVGIPLTKGYSFRATKRFDVTDLENEAS